MTPVRQPVMERRSRSRYLATDTEGLPYDPDRTVPGITYGLSWWACRQNVGGRQIWAWYMNGNYGQTCMVCPARGMVLTKLNSPRKPPFIGGAELWPHLIASVRPECLPDSA